MDAHDLVLGISREPPNLDNKDTVNPRYEELHHLAQGVLKGPAKDLGHSKRDY